jgi:hypothetical protein
MPDIGRIKYRQQCSWELGKEKLQYEVQQESIDDIRKTTVYE